MNISGQPQHKMVGQLARLARGLILGGSLATGLAGTAAAQNFSLFGSTSGARLTPDDNRVATAALVKLLNESPATPGHYEHWNNPTSGNGGKLTIQNLYTKNGLPCRHVTSTITFNARSGLAPRDTTLGACQLPNGEWRSDA
jgi:surface antigen